MPTPKFICGAECGIAALGTLSAGTEHWSTGVAVSGFTVVTSGPSSMRSTRCFRVNTVGSSCSLTHQFATAIASPSTTVLRCYVYFATLPSADVNLILIASTQQTGLMFEQSTGKLRSFVATTKSTGITVTTGQWYRIDLKTVNNTTCTADLQVDGVADTQVSVAGSAALASQITFGFGTSVTGDMYLDDIIVSGTSGDYPIGDGTVVGLYPNGDKTNTVASGAGNFGHQFSAAGDFGKGTGGATNTAAQNVEATSWQSLDNPLTTTASGSWVSNLLGAVGEILVWTMDDLPAGAASVNGVMCVATTHSAAATANDFGNLTAYDNAGSQTTPAVILGDMSEITITVPIGVYATAPGTAPWTVARVNSSNAAWGSSSDVNPDVYLDGLCWEVDYVPTPPATAPPLKINPYRQLLNH